MHNDRAILVTALQQAVAKYAEKKKGKTLLGSIPIDDEVLEPLSAAVAGHALFADSGIVITWQLVKPKRTPEKIRETCRGSTATGYAVAPGWRANPPRRRGCSCALCRFEPCSRDASAPPLRCGSRTMWQLVKPKRIMAAPA
jgi:hypothetical protein